MSQVGDKGTLTYRLDLFDKCQAKELTVDGDINPCLLKGNDLKKCASKLGVSPMLLPDEILAELITILEASGSKKQKQDEGSSSSSSAGGSSDQSGGGKYTNLFMSINECVHVWIYIIVSLYSLALCFDTSTLTMQFS